MVITWHLKTIARINRRIESHLVTIDSWLDSAIKESFQNLDR